MLSSEGRISVVTDHYAKKKLLRWESEGGGGDTVEIPLRKCMGKECHILLLDLPASNGLLAGFCHTCRLTIETKCTAT